jgi:hypothetical protein
MFPLPYIKSVQTFYNTYMENVSSDNKKRLKELQAELKRLQAQLVIASRAEGLDPHIEVKLLSNHMHFTRVSVEDGPDKGFGQFSLSLGIAAKKEVIYIPLSVASGIKQAGFMYQIEGSTAGSIKTATVTCKGMSVSQVTLGTLLFAKIEAGTTATFAIEATVKGQVGQMYKIAITRINYKLNLTDTRYQQYLKAIESKNMKFA